MVYLILGLRQATNQGLQGAWRQLFTTPLQAKDTPSAVFSYSAAMKGSYVLFEAAMLVAALAATVAGQQTKDAGPQSPVDALHKLVHAGRHEDMAAKADSLPLDDPSWKSLFDVLVEAAEQRKDYRYLKRKAQEVMLRGRDSETRAIAAFALGIGNWRSGQLSEAVAAFSEAIRITPDSELAFNAEDNIHEIKDLRVGQPAPHFVAQTTSGSRIDSNDLRGKTALLNFWASW